MPQRTPLSMLACVRPAEARAEVMAALAATDGNATRAAAALGVSRMSVYRLIESLGLRLEVDRRWPERRGEHSPGRTGAPTAAARAKARKRAKRVGKRGGERGG